MKKILIFLCLNIFLGIFSNYFPYALMKVNVTSDNDTLKFYFYTGNESVPYDENNTLVKNINSNILNGEVWAIIPRRSIDKFRINFPGVIGKYSIENVNIYDNLFFYRKIGSSEFFSSFVKTQNLTEYKLDNYVEVSYSKADAFVATDKVIYDKSINWIFLCSSLIILIILLIYEVYFNNIKRLHFKYRLLRLIIYHKYLFNDIKSFVEFYRRNSLVLVFLIIYTFFCYGFKVFNYSISIDSEFGIFFSNLEPWIRDGRFGIAILKIIFGNLTIVPYISNYLAVISFSFSALLWLYLIIWSSNFKIKSVTSYILFIILYISYPSTSEFMNFSTYNFEVALGQVFAALSIFLLINYIKLKNNLYLFYGSLFFIWSISIYQSISFLNLIGFAIFLIVSLSYYERNNNEIIVNLIIKYTKIIFISFIIYLIFNKIINVTIKQFNYLDGFIGWGKRDFAFIFFELKQYIGGIILGDYIHCGKLYLLAIFALIFLAVYNLLRQYFINKLKALLFLFIVIAPFIMPVILGAPLPIRSQVSLPLISSFAAFWVLNIIEKKNILKNILILFLFIISFYQAYAISFLFHGEYIKSQMDIAIAHKISNRIEMLGLVDIYEKPIVYIGKYNYKLKEEVGLRKEMIGASFFEWGEYGRTFLFMQALGYNYRYPSKEDYEFAKIEARSMPNWPHPNSVQIRKNIIVVKFSDE